MNRIGDRKAGTTTLDRLRALAGDQPRYTRRQTEILDAIEAIFLQEGFRSCTVDELASRVRCSTRTLYELARTKEDLLLLVLDRMWSRAATEARIAMADAQDPAGKLTAFLHSAVGILGPPWSLHLIQDIANYRPANQRFEEHLEAAIQLLVDIIADGIRIGQFHSVDPRLLAEFLAAGAMRIATKDMLDTVGTDALTAVYDVTQLLLTGLLRRPGKLPPSKRTGR